MFSKNLSSCKTLWLVWLLWPKRKILEKVSPDLCYLSEFTQILVFEMLYDLIENLPALSKLWALIPGSVIRAGSKYLQCLLKANPTFSVGSQLQLDFRICVPVLSDMAKTPKAQYTSMKIDTTSCNYCLLKIIRASCLIRVPMDRK